MKKNPLTLTVIFISSSFNVLAEDYFDSSMLAAGLGDNIDLSLFSRPGGGIEGPREVSVYINGNFFVRKSLNFKNNDDGTLLPEFASDFFDDVLNDEYISKNSNIISTTEFLERIPYSSITFEQSSFRVDISVPQASLGNKMKLKSSPDSWELGIPALLSDYYLSGSRNWGKNYSSENLYVSSLLGLNIEGWRLRSSLNYSRYQTEYNHRRKDYSQSGFYNTYLERDIGILRSTFRLGELSTGGMILDPVSFHGAKLYSNDEMLNRSLRNYTPTVRGVANSQAVVTITQNGREVYQTNVPAGPFELNDFYISGYSGDMVVTIRESDGSEHSFVQPYSTLPEMKREGVFGYELSAGRYDGSGAGHYYNDTPFIYGSWSQGFPYGITLFGETLQADKYQTMGLGSTLSLGMLGAVSGDISVSRAEKYGDVHTGQSYGFKYSKSQVETGSTLTLATYRYSTKDFYTFRDFVSNTDEARYIWDNRLKNRMSISLNQSLGSYGNLSLSGSQQDYWTSDEVSRSLSLSHSFNWRNIYVNTMFSMDQYHGGKWRSSENKQIGLYLTVPINRLLGLTDPTNSSLSYSATRSEHQVRQNINLAGSIPGTNTRYRVGGSWGNGGIENSHNASLNWNGNYVDASLGYTRTGNTQTIDYGFSGSAVLYPWGIAMGADSIMSGAIVVQTKGASGVRIRQNGKETTLFGTALLSSPDPYTENRIDLDPSGLPDDIVLADTMKTTVPQAGAVVLLDYTVFKGFQVVFTLKQPDGKPLPFGTVVALEGSKNGKENTGIVGEDGRVYFGGIPEKGMLRASWGKNKECRVDFRIGNKKTDTPVTEINGTCK